MGLYDAVKQYSEDGTWPEGQGGGGLTGGIVSGVGKVGKGLSGLAGLNPFGGRSSEYGEVDPNNRISDLAGSSTRMGWEGLTGYRNMTGELARDREYLRGLQSGRNSVSAEQLRQGLQQNLAAQRSMAAAARPGNAAMAARTASMNAARLGGGLAGQQALAGIAERNAAASQLAALNLGQRQQDIGMQLGNTGNALQGYGMLEQARTSRYQADMGVPSDSERLMGLGGGLIQAKMLKPDLKSDRRAKKDIKRADVTADRLLKTLKPYSWKYKDKADGEGEYMGPMAQDIEKSGVKGVVKDTPSGKVVDGGRLAAALAATLPGLDKRLSKLEGKGT